MSDPPKLSLIAQFDDFARCVWGLVDSDVTEHYIETARTFETICGRAAEVENECQRLQRELNEAMHTISGLESKLTHARRMHDAERRGRVRAEQEIEKLDRNMNLARDLLFNDTRNQLNDETREKLMQLHNSTTKSRRSLDGNARNSRLNTITELETTGSLLSDLSYSKSEDDLLNDTETRAGWNEHESFSEMPIQKRRRSSSEKVFEINANDRVVATTTLTMGKDGGQIQARSVIEAIAEDTEPENSNTSKLADAMHPALAQKNEQLDSVAKHKYLPQSPLYSRNTETQSRQHTFLTKHSVSARIVCGPCGKKISFGVYVKCKDCKSTAHVKECADAVPLPCVPVGGTPTLKGQMGTVGDYAPKFSPMIPSLIVHCVNEVELRGLTEIGIYRVPGSEKDVKSLKEVFLRGKGTPNLSNIEVHVICGTIKDFLRSLREPLLTTMQRGDFITAIDSNDPRDIEPILYQIIAELPQPNRDTLAFLMLHLQNVAESKYCKMPITNLSKIFGPTLVGYADQKNKGQDIDSLLIETRQQVTIVEHLLNLPNDYWRTFINVNGLQARQNVPELKHTPSTESLFKSQRFFNTPLKSGNPGASKIIRKRKFFDNTPKK